MDITIFDSLESAADTSKVDFIAVLKYRTTEHGGRTTAAVSGYRPQVKFDFAEKQTSGAQYFINKELVFPGERVDAAIKVVAVDFFKNALTEGMEFEFCEGAVTMGVGKIKQIVNPELQRIS